MNSYWKQFLNPPDHLPALKKAGDHIITRFLEREHPQVATVIAAHLTPSRLAHILPQLSSQRQVELIKRLAKLESVPQDLLLEVNQSLEEAIKLDQNTVRPPHAGIAAAGQLLRQLSSQQRQSMFDELSKKNPQLAEKIKKAVFTFEDLKQYPPELLPLLWQKFPKHIWMLALKKASPELKSLFLKLMSSRAQDNFMDDLTAMPKVPISEVEKVQQSIAEEAEKILHEYYG